MSAGNEIRHRGRVGPGGFTLVELLVVIAIISLLAGLLLPALEQAVSSARTVACASQFRQILTGTAVYANDNDDILPVLNSGREGNMGMFHLLRGTPFTTLNVANAEIALRDGLFASFAATGMDVPLSLKDPTSKDALNISEIFKCPGLPDPMFLGMSLNRESVSFGDSIYRQCYVLGFGSVLGQNTRTLGNCCIRTDALKTSRVRKPSTTVVINDLLNVGGTSNSFALRDGPLMVPHGVGDTPTGSNQGTLDGAVAFAALANCNRAYQPGYPWDNKVRVPMILDTDNDFFFGGDPKLALGWPATLPTLPTSWQGINTVHTPKFTP